MRASPIPSPRVRAFGRAWLLGAVRRPGRAVVVVCAVAVMTTATVAALVAADTLDRLFLADAAAGWGQVDVEVTSAQGATFSESAARTVAFEAIEVTERAAPRLVLPAVAATADRQEPDALVLGLGAEEQSMGELDVIAGRGDVISLLSLQPDEAIVNARLAGRLGLEVGELVSVLVVVPEIRRAEATADRPEVSSPTTVELPLRVAGIVADTGVADLHRRPAVLVRRDVLQVLTGTEGLVTVLHVSAPQPGRDAAQQVIREFELVMRQLGLTAAAVQADAVDVAEDEGAQFRSILLTLAVLAIGSAVVATVNLLTAMGEARRDELSLMRIMGMRRRQAATAVLAESAVYAPLGVVVGAVAGIGMGGLIAGRLADRFASIGRDRGREAVSLAVDVRPTALLLAAAIVLAAALWAGSSAGRQLAAADLEDALRGVPPSRRVPPSGLARPVLLGVLGAALLGMGLTADLAGDALRFLGLTLILGAIWLWARRAGDGRLADPDAVDRVASAVAVVWAVGGAALLGDFSQGYETGFGILVVSAATAILGAVVLTVQVLRPALRPVVERVRPGRVRAPLGLAVAAAADAPRRSAATQGVVAAVLFMVAALHVLGSATAIDPARQGGGFDVLATSAAPLDIRALARLDGLDGVVALEVGVVGETAYRVEDDDEVTYEVRYPVRLIPAADELISAQDFGLADALPGYTTAEEALQAVRSDGRKAVVDRYARPEGAELGDDVVIDAGAGPRRYELIAVLDTFLLGGVVLPQEDVGSIVPTVGPTFALATARPPTTPAALAEALEAAGRARGVDARSMAEVAEDLVEVNRTFTDVFTLLVVLGLLVALAAEGSLVLRAGRERRLHAAVLRSLGVRRRGVAAALVLERLLMAVLGGTLGLVVGVGVLRLLFAVGFSDLAFVLDWRRLGLAGLVVLVVLTAVTSLAAVPAARHRPAEGLRDLG